MVAAYSFPRTLAVLAMLVLLAPVPPAHGAQAGPPHPKAAEFFPEADAFGPFEGEPPAAAVYRDGEVIGYLLRTKEVAPIPAYSGKPVDLLVGFDTKGTIRGAYVLEHHEPILLVGIPESRLQEFAAQYAGKRLTDRIRIGGGSQGEVSVDGVSGATVTVMVVDRTIMKAARRVAHARGVLRAGGAQGGRARIRTDIYRRASWEDLVEAGAFGHLRLTSAEVDRALRRLGARLDPPPAAPDELFIDLWFAIVDPPVVGRNLLGDEQYRWLMGQLEPGEHVLAVLANGRYSFKGSGYVRGGIFDRVQLSQGEQTILFRDLDHHRLADVYLEGMPEFREMALFVIRAGYEFDPGRPYRLELLVRQQTGPTDSVFTTFSATHALPEAWLERPPAAAEAAEEGGAEAEEPMWVGVWKRRWPEVAVLLAGLGFLTVVLFMQDVLVRQRRLVVRLRTGFLLFTVGFIGWYALGQLSIVNVFTFLGSLVRGFRWETFLVDPILFVLWTYVAAAVLLWGRGVFCGWLCPFGAMQKLLNEAARRLRVPQLVLPSLVHERLLAVKYVILLVLFGISLQSLATAERFAEVEPFKTAILLHFQREWPYVLYAVGLLVVGVFSSKFYCKYLCPLGAALALPTRLRVFDWLKRRKECGRPCQICAKACEIQAIRPTGEINAHECHYCLDCQVIYWDDRICPPLVERRRRRERAAGARRAAARMAEVLRGPRPAGEPAAGAPGPEGISEAGASGAEREGR